MPDTMAARWHVVTGDQDMVTLHVSLWNDHAITLTAWQDDRVVMRWQGTQGADFSGDTLGSFKAWLAEAQGRR